MNAIRPFAQKNAYPLLKLYSLLSLLAATMFFVQDFVFHTKLHPDSFLTSLFLVGHLSFWFGLQFKGLDLLDLKRKSWASALFLFQIVMLPLLAYQQQDSSYLFFAVIPCSASTFVELAGVHRHWRWSWMARTTYLTGIFCLLFLTMELSRYSLYQGQVLKAVNMLVFMIWTQGLIGMVFSGALSSVKSSLKTSVKTHTTQNEAQPNISPEQLFYHDMINVTHGVLLFLKQKSHDQRTLDNAEMAMVTHEIESLQSYLKDHFKFGHKNLTKAKNLVNFTEAQAGLYSIIHTFLLQQGVQAQLFFHGLLDEKKASPEAIMVHYPSLHRIFTNLIKNVYDHRAQMVEIIFEANENFLTITVKNPVKKQLSESQGLEKSLGQLILDTDFETSEESQGLGLESVQELSQQLGGSFQCSIVDGVWISEVKLPHPQQSALYEVLPAA